ncbi:MAG: GNAT family N-acetyltransferase [Chloroflexia bacterium]|nr:GNAT family N-acetyltransferase [Chloroflexia bacterium]
MWSSRRSFGTGKRATAQQRSSNFGTSLEYERAQAERQYAELLPTGAGTKDNHFWTITQTGAPVGFLWVRVDEAARHAFLFEIAVHSEYRGRGYGGRALDLLKEDLKRMGVSRIGLNVFADNHVAIGLYQKHGYTTTNLNLQKNI